MKKPTLHVALALLTALLIAACNDGSPTSPSAVSDVPTSVLADGDGNQRQTTGHKPGHGGGPGGGGGGGGGTESDFSVEMVPGGISWPGPQDMQAKRDNKKALAAEGTINGFSMSFDFSDPSDPQKPKDLDQCRWTGKDSGTPWTHPSVEALRRALGEASLQNGIPPEYPQERAVNFQVNHDTASGAIRMLSVPEGAHPWLSYCFNTGERLCSVDEASTPLPGGGVERTFKFSGSAVRAVHNGVELVCKVNGVGAEIKVTPK